MSAVWRFTRANSRRSTVPTSKTSDRSRRSNGSSCSIAAGPWWTGPAVTVRRARAGTASSVAAGSVGRPGAPIEIRLADGQCTVATGAHELAHALAGVEHGHDAVFRRAYLDVVAMGTNLDPLDRRGTTHVDQLAEAFESAGMALAERRWPPPDAGTVGAIAL